MTGKCLTVQWQPKKMWKINCRWLQKLIIFIDWRFIFIFFSPKREKQHIVVMLLLSFECDWPSSLSFLRAQSHFAGRQMARTFPSTFSRELDSVEPSYHVSQCFFPCFTKCVFPQFQPIDLKKKIQCSQITVFT